MGSIAPAIWALRLAGLSGVPAALLIRSTMEVGKVVQPHLLSYIDQQTVSSYQWPSTSSYMVHISLSPGIETSASSFDTRIRSRRTHLLGRESWRLYYASNR